METCCVRANPGIFIGGWIQRRASRRMLPKIDWLSSVSPQDVDDFEAPPSDFRFSIQWLRSRGTPGSIWTKQKLLIILSNDSPVSLSCSGPLEPLSEPTSAIKVLPSLQTQLYEGRLKRHSLHVWKDDTRDDWYTLFTIHNYQRRYFNLCFDAKLNEWLKIILWLMIQ